MGSQQSKEDEPRNKAFELNICCTSSDRTTFEAHEELVSKQKYRMKSPKIKVKPDKKARDGKGYVGTELAEDYKLADASPAISQSTGFSTISDDDEVHDRDFFGDNEITLKREGLVAEIFDSKVLDSVRDRIPPNIIDFIDTYGFFQYRPREHRSVKYQESALEITQIEDVDGNGTFYYGQYHAETEKPEGRGILIYKDGAVYEGLLRLGRKHSAGRMHFINGDIYQGEWEYDVVQGYGVYIAKDGKASKNTDDVASKGRPSMKGDWKKGLIHGQAFQIFEDYHYRGECAKGARCGKGVLTKTDELADIQPDKVLLKGNMVLTYEGDFQNNSIHGNGILERADGRKYIGQFQDDLMEGKGRFIWPNGDEYEGQYHNDEKEGRGKFRYHNGSIYTGQFKDGRPHGFGKFCDKRGNIKKGRFEHGHFVDK